MTEVPHIAVEARKITKKFAGVAALRDVDLRVYAGKVNAIVGENGAGKSTLMNILAGVYTDYEGSLLVDGKPVNFQSTTDARRVGIAIIHQELNLVSHLSIAENIFLGREPLTFSGLIDYKKMRGEAIKVLQRLHFSENPKTKIADLRVGRQQLVEIAKALSLNAQVLIMDEPTSSLSEGETAALFEVIRSLTAKGVAIVYITHKMDELAQLADYVTVLRDGMYIGEMPVKNASTDEIVKLMVGRDPKDFFVKKERKKGNPVLDVKDFSLKNAAYSGRCILDKISFHVSESEVLGIYGLMGSGRTELFEALFGLHAGYTSGAVRIGGAYAGIKSPSDAVRSGMALIPEDRKSSGLVLDMSIAENVSLASLGKLLKYGLLSKRRERRAADEYRGKLGVKSYSSRQLVAKLSGGNQQKIVLAKWLLTNPKILLLDEPTRGIDINAKNEIYKLIDELAAQKMAIVVVSSELPEIMAISDRIITLCNGKITGELVRNAFSEESILKKALPSA
ncbi:MAG: sugar ABC transporter ATP-binding protein [Prevotellaceae bacterium]|jgi:ribose transport system ATP-binding protein|nr:sugar ABC transporter ATP-binding protein [Prevotellaceae bacterium]